MVPAAGWGTRLRPLSDTLPKEMLPVGRRVVLERIFDELSCAGIERIVLVVSPRKEPLLRARFGTNSGGLCVEYALQSEMRGLGDAVLCAAPNVDGEPAFLVALGDAVFLEAAPGALIARLIDTKSPIAVAVQKVPRERISRYGIVVPIGEASGISFPIGGLIEKPAPEDAPSEFAVAARYALPAGIFNALRAFPVKKGCELSLTDGIASLLSRGVAGVAVPLLPKEVRHDIGTFETYYQAFLAFALADAEHGASLRQFIKEIEKTEL